MKWDIWVDPNQIIEEEYPDGWNADKVARAANNRYGGMVTNVNPSCIGSYSNTSSGGGTPDLGNFGALGGLAILVFMGWIFIEFMPFVLAGVGGYLGLKIGRATPKPISAALILTILIGGLGYYQGEQWKPQVQSMFEVEEIQK